MIVKTAQTPALARQAVGNESTPAVYRNPAAKTTPNRMVVEKRLGGIVQALHRSRIRKSERQRLLLLAGTILLDHLGREPLGAAK